MEIQVLASSSKANCYRVSDGKYSLLLEAGLPVREIRKGLDFRLREIAGCLVTHGHLDHFKAAGDLMRSGIDCWMSFGTASTLAPEGNHRLHLARAGEQLKIGSWAIMPFAAIHDAEEPLGFLLASGKDKLLFLTDSAYVPAKFSGLTRIMIECNYQEDVLRDNIRAGRVVEAQKNRLLRAHLSLENVCRFLESTDKSRLEEVHLLHVSRSNADPEAMVEAVSGIVDCPVFIAGG